MFLLVFLFNFRLLAVRVTDERIGGIGNSDTTIASKMTGDWAMGNGVGESEPRLKKGMKYIRTRRMNHHGDFRSVAFPFLVSKLHDSRSVIR